LSDAPAFALRLPLKLGKGVAARRLEIAMAGFWADWIEALRFGCEAQSVISARLMLFASGAPDAAEEAERMITEKIAAFSDAQLAAERALAGGLGLYATTQCAYLPVRSAVHANSLRLNGGLH
jgi:hypothetical protein